MYICSYKPVRFHAQTQCCIASDSLPSMNVFTQMGIYCSDHENFPLKSFAIIMVMAICNYASCCLHAYNYKVVYSYTFHCKFQSMKDTQNYHNGHTKYFGMTIVVILSGLHTFGICSVRTGSNCWFDLIFNLPSQ